MGEKCKGTRSLTSATSATSAPLRLRGEGPFANGLPTTPAWTLASETANLHQTADLRGGIDDDRSYAQTTGRFPQPRLFAPQFRANCHDVNRRSCSPVFQ